MWRHDTIHKTINPQHTDCHQSRTVPQPQITQPSTLCGMVKRVSAFGLSNNNKWRWWMRMVAAIYRRTHSPSRLAWSEGWRPPGAQYAFIKWTGWTFAVTMVMRTAHKHCRWLLLLFIIITCTENFTKFRRGFWDMQVDRHTDADCNPSHSSRWQSNKLNRSLNNNQY